MRAVSLAAVLAFSTIAAVAQDFGDAAASDWSGVFVGVTGGIGIMSVTGTDTGRGPFGPWYTAGAAHTDEAAGALGGVRGAVNWTHGNAVFGIEADLAVASLHLRQRELDVVAETDVDWLGTLRARAGANLPNLPAPTLVYATGGLAVAGIEHTIADTDPTLPGDGLFGPSSESATRTGYAIGAGVETAMTDRVTFGVEYLFMDFGTTTVDGICVVCFDGSSPGDPFPFDFDTRLHTIRANLTWRIGG